MPGPVFHAISVGLGNMNWMHCGSVHIISPGYNKSRAAEKKKEKKQFETVDAIEAPRYFPPVTV